MCDQFYHPQGLVHQTGFIHEPDNGYTETQDSRWFIVINTTIMKLLAIQSLSLSAYE